MILILAIFSCIIFEKEKQIFSLLASVISMNQLLFQHGIKNCVLQISILMNSRKKPEQVVSFQSTKSVDWDEKELKTITAEDKFPCYSCFDKPKQRINCDVCNKKGFVSGDHPMVKFIDDFLSKNLTPQVKTPSQLQKQSYVNESQPTSLSSDDEKFPLDKRKNCRKKEVRSAFDSYPQENNFSSSTEGPKNLIKSSNQTKNSTQTHFGYSCDECGDDPISGIRFHCSICPDFDICEKCHSSFKHQHPLTAINKEKKSLKIEASQVIENLKKSTASRNSKNSRK